MESSGAVNSSIWTRDSVAAAYPAKLNAMKKVLSVISISNKRGALTAVYLATSPEAALPEVRGKYWDQCRWKWTPAWMADGKLRAALWEQWEIDSGVKLVA